MYVLFIIYIQNILYQYKVVPSMIAHVYGDVNTSLFTFDRKQKKVIYGKLYYGLKYQFLAEHLNIHILKNIYLHSFNLT